MRTRLTARRLEAIIAALHESLAGALDHETLERRDFEAALAWAEEQLERRVIYAAS